MLDRNKSYLVKLENVDQIKKGELKAIELGYRQDDAVNILREVVVDNPTRYYLWLEFNGDYGFLNKNMTVLDMNEEIIIEYEDFLKEEKE